MERQSVGIVGVGLMGHGIAANIVAKGWPLGFLDHPGNQPTGDLVEAGAWSCVDPAELAARCDTVILCVTGSPQVEAVLTGESGLLAGMRPGAIVIDCSTALPDSTRRMAALVAAAGGHMLDAPMTRTPKEAAEGRLNLIVGGDSDIFARCLPLLKAFAENIVHAGETGAGHTMKLLHNYVSLGFSAVLCEAAAASNRAGIDPAVLTAVLGKGAGAGVVFDRIAPYIARGDMSGLRFTLANAFKDIDYYSAMAAHLGSADGVALAVRDIYGKQVEAGQGARYVPELIDLL